MKYFYRFTKSNIKFVTAVITIVAVSSLCACASDRARSEQLFEKYCNEKGRVGQFIYERVALGEEYFRPIPTDAKELRYVNEEFYIDNKKTLIDQERLKQSYAINYQKKTMLSPIGPIYSFESTIVRKSDDKVLSKAVSLLNMLDKNSKYFPVEGVTCPTGRDSKGYSLSNKHHFNLIEKTFLSNNSF